MPYAVIHYTWVSDCLSHQVLCHGNVISFCCISKLSSYNKKIGLVCDSCLLFYEAFLSST